MRKNAASQAIGAQMITAADGTAFTGAVTVSVTGDAGTQATGSVGSGACTHEGNGYHTYAPAQAETNYNLVAFTFTGTGAIPVTVQVYTRPTTGILAPTVADRTLDVTATGAAGIDWGNVENPAAEVDLSATAAAIADAVWTELIADHSGVSGSTAESLAAAQSAGDPWATDLPGSYTGLDAGAILSGIKTKTDLISSGDLTIDSRIDDTDMLLFIGEQHAVTLTTADYTAKTLEMAWETEDSTTDVATIADGSLTKSTSSVVFTVPAAVTTSSRNLRWSLRDTANGDEVLAYGLCKVRATAHAD